MFLYWELLGTSSIFDHGEQVLLNFLRHSSNFCLEDNPPNSSGLPWYNLIHSFHKCNPNPNHPSWVLSHFTIFFSFQTSCNTYERKLELILKLLHRKHTSATTLQSRNLGLSLWRWRLAAWFVSAIHWMHCSAPTRKALISAIAFSILCRSWYSLLTKRVRSFFNSTSFPIQQKK